MLLLPLLFVLSSSICSATYNVTLLKENVTSLHVITILSAYKEQDSQSVRWMQGEEILNGARDAVKDINNNPVLQRKLQVVLIPVLVPNCDPVKGIQQLLEALVDPNLNVVGSVGMFCDRLAESYSPVLNRWAERNKLSRSSSSSQNITTTTTLPSYVMSLHEVAADAIISLLNGLNWTKIGVVNSQPDYAFPNYYNLAETLEKTISSRHDSKIKILFKYNLNKRKLKDVNLFLQALMSSNINIMLLFLPPHIATTVIQRASEEDLTWPRFVWIVVHSGPSAVTPPSIGEKLIFLSYKIQRSDTSKSAYFATNDFLKTAHQRILYNSVLDLVLGGGCRISRYCIQNTDLENAKINFSSHDYDKQSYFQYNHETLIVEIILVNNRRAYVVGQYNPSTSMITLHYDLLTPVPPDEFEYRYLTFSTSIFIVLVLWLLFVYIVVTIHLSLFLIFRKEHEVKASSVSLSLCIFAGCYLMLVSSTNTIFDTNVVISREGIRHSSCNVNQISASVGIDLVTATALVRTLRIYHIFTHFNRLSKSWSDSRLSMVVLAVICVKLGIFILWMSSDNYHLIDTANFQRDAVPPYYLVIQSCYSNYQLLWSLSVYMYTLILLAPLIFYVIKTRKVTLDDFRDTKKTTVLVTCGLLFLTVFGTLWVVLRLSGHHIGSYIALVLGYSTCSFAIQIFLLWPKVFPPLSRYMKKHLK